MTTSFPPRPKPPAIDLGSLSTPYTPLDAAQAAEIARTHYAIIPRAQAGTKRLATEKDDTFLIRTTDGAGVILKIANPGESAGELDLQLQCFLHLQSVAPDLPVPRVHPDRQGRALIQIESPDGPRLVRMMSFLEGQVLDSLPPCPTEQHQIGATLAELRLAMAGFHHPHAARALAWDVRHLPSLADLLDQVEAPTQHRTLARAFARITAFSPRINALPRQVVHNDFSRSNILVARGAPDPIRGIIDFGDVVETAIAIDLSTAMLNQLPRDRTELGEGAMFDGPRRVLEGYLSRAPLSPEELALLPHLVFARAVTRALLTLWRARQFPQNAAYILRNTQQGWAQLEWYLAQDDDALQRAMGHLQP